MSRKLRLLDQVRAAIPMRHYSYRTEKQYLAWLRRFIRYHEYRNPIDLGAAALFHHAPVGSGSDIHTVQELMDHASVKTTQIYTHVLNRSALGVRSPLDIS